MLPWFTFSITVVQSSGRSLKADRGGSVAKPCLPIIQIKSDHILIARTRQNQDMSSFENLVQNSPKRLEKTPIKLSRVEITVTASYVTIRAR